MPAYYFKCHWCDVMYVTGEEVPGGISCGVCLKQLEELSQEEVEEAVEDMRNER